MWRIKTLTSGKGIRDSHQILQYQKLLPSLNNMVGLLNSIDWLKHHAEYIVQ